MATDKSHSYAQNSMGVCKHWLNLCRIHTLKYYIAYPFEYPSHHLYKWSTCTCSCYCCFHIIIRKYNKRIREKEGWNKLLYTIILVKNQTINVLNDNLDVANRYHVSSEVVGLDHRWWWRKQGKAHFIMKKAKNYKPICYQFTEIMWQYTPLKCSLKTHTTPRQW